MTLINKTKFLNHTDFIIRLLYKHSYYSLHCIMSFLFFTVTMRLSLFLLNEHVDDDDDDCLEPVGRICALLRNNYAVTHPLSKIPGYATVIT